MSKANIEAAIQSVLGELGAGEVSFAVERPGDFAHGDYATNAALAAAKILKKNPKDVAAELAQRLEGKIVGIKKIEVAGVGFINFTISGMTIKDIVHEAHGEGWGSNDLYKGKSVMIDYTQPNPFKPFHIGHLMSNAIGESLAGLLERSGAKVLRVNYQGDVGPHVAKALWGMKKLGVIPDDIDGIGKAYVEGTNAYEAYPEAKAEIDSINKKVYEKSDPEINTLYDAGRKASLEHFEELYRMLGTKFDEYYFESESWQPGLASVKKHTGDVFEESQGAIIFPGEKYGLNTRVFVTSAGLPTYEGKEIGLIDLKFNKHTLDLSIVETAVEQKNMFEVAFKAAELINPSLNGKLKHIYHGLMRFADGKMSSRTGNVITGESLLKDLQNEAKAKMEGRSLADANKVAEQVAVGAIKYSVLKQGSGKDIIFDPEKSLSVEGDSGPYLQYALVRARSLLRKAADAEVVDPEPSGPGSLERLLMHFPEVVAHAAEELEPHYVVTYLTELAAAFNSWYAGERFIVDGKVSRRTVAVIKAVENTLAKGLQMLGIPAPEQM